jgi:hypothetical protein
MVGSSCGLAKRLKTAQKQQPVTIFHSSLSCLHLDIFKIYKSIIIYIGYDYGKMWVDRACV